ncbi:proline-serine-threonine phosphatase-interacting protein 1-like [Gadus chalcogrammus]|uniref:proline-serine-threonine phosphatase-interacting protein 1-like n=1 Tax=Gadus chalcogrammus TaxID=1042646 RepID=UPI0024C4D4C2|nr:proline-serine-threonine phosphatase-interacting protein 1-like [Gadus chalcogrammus]
MELSNRMTPLLFKDAFWGRDFTSREGYDTLIDRLKDGRQICKDVQELIKMRAQAEEQYGKELVLIAHKARGLKEIGTLRASFDQLKAHIENIGNFHIHLSNVLEEEVKRIEIFQEKQKAQRKKFESIMEKLMKTKSSWYKKTMESKKNSKQRCQEATEAENLAAKMAATSSTPKIIEKAYQKVQHCKQTAAESESLYLGNIVHLENVRQDWIGTHQSTCEVFQQLESDRISFLRCVLWDHCNHFSMQCVKDDEIYEDVRKGLEKCEISTDNNLFIQTKSTSSSPPEPVMFRNYSVLLEESQGSPSNLSTLGRASVSESLSIIHRVGSNSSLTDGNPYTESTRNSSGSLNCSNTSGFQQTSSRASVALNDSYRVAYEYMAQNTDELTLLRGEVVQLMEQGDDGWWTVERDGEVGLVPGNYLAQI